MLSASRIAFRFLAFFVLFGAATAEANDARWSGEWNATNAQSAIRDSRLYLYDDWNLLAEIDASTASVVRSYVWGRDFSGDPGSQGVVGGLRRQW